MLSLRINRRAAAVATAVALAAAGSVIGQASSSAVPSNPSVVSVANTTLPNTPYNDAAIRVTFTDVNSAEDPGYTAFCQKLDGSNQVYAEGAGTAVGGNLYLDVKVEKGKTYKCEVALGANDSGFDQSAMSSQITTWDVPSAPSLSGSVTASSVTATWSAPFDGGTAITKYQCQKNVSTWTNLNLTTSCTMSSLSLGQTVTLTVRAVSSLGTGTPSSISLTTSQAPNPPTSVSSANSSSTLSNGKIAVTFSGAQAQGSPITGYQATCTSSDGGASGSVTGASSPLTVQNLTLGKTYTCTVKATDGVNGYGSNSSASNTAIPVATPAKPSITGVVASPNSAAVNFTVSQVNNGATTTYEYSFDGVIWTVADVAFAGTTGTFATATGASDFSTLRLRATNSAGNQTSNNWNSTAVLSGAGSYQCGDNSTQNLGWSGRWQTESVNLGPNVSGNVTDTKIRCDVTKEQIDEISNPMLATYASWNQLHANGYQGAWYSTTTAFADGDMMRITSTTLTGGGKGKTTVGVGNPNIYVEGTVRSGGHWDWIPYGSSSGDSVNIQLSKDGGQTWTTLWVLTVSL